MQANPLPKNVHSDPLPSPTCAKPRLLFVSTLPCEPSTGGKIQFYRHLVESDDFQMDFVQEHNVSAINYLETGFAPIDACLKRGIKTRFFPNILATNLLMAEWRKRNTYLEQAKAFQPDAIVTVAYGSYSFVAASLARRLKKPLITFFHDWWPDLTLCRGQSKKVLDYKFRQLYQDSALALCVSDTMQQELGPHPNAPVLYPIPGPRQAVPTWTPPTPSEQNPFKVVYLGTLLGGYGKLVQTLSQVLSTAEYSPVQFNLYGPATDWPQAALADAQSRGLYGGARYGAEAQAVLNEADAFLVVMSFTEDQRRYVRTSFPSKLLEYSAYGKPIIVWGPEESTAVQFARKYQAAAIVTSPDPQAVLQCCAQLSQDMAQQSQLAAAAHRIYTTLFDPHNIHQQFLAAVRQVLQSQSTPTQ
jgi:hypothetical protein